MRVDGAHRPGRARCPCGLHRPDHAHLVRGTRDRSTCRRSSASSHPTWARSSCRPRRCPSRTPTTSPAAWCSRIEDLQALREWATSAGTRIHVDGARIWNAHVATGTAAGGVRRRGRRDGRLPVQGTRRADRFLAGGVRGRDRRVTGVAQADGRRHAAGGHPRRGRAPRAGPPHRAARGGSRERPAPGRGVWSGPGDRGHQHRRRAPRGRRRSSSPRHARPMSSSPRSDPPPYAWSRTSTSPATTPSGRQRCSAGCRGSRPQAGEPTRATSLIAV